MSTVTITEYTAEDLLRMPDGDLYELVDGQLVERKFAATSSWVAGEIHRRLGNHVNEQNLGWAFPEGTSYQCFAVEPERVRKPDASFVAAGRFDNDLPPEEGHVRIPPDLAVEVVSPNDSYFEVDQKVEEFLEAGVRLVWVINPETRTAKVYRPGEQAVAHLHANDELSGEDVLPGFRCRVGDLFPRKLASATRVS